MQFLLIAKDYPDAAERRLACREAHLKFIEKFRDNGQVIVGGAIFNDAGTMIGSAVICDFPSKEAIHTDWLVQDPYITNRVWETIDIMPYAIAAPFKGRTI